MRLVVVDTNLLVAGLITADVHSPTAQILNGMLDGTLLALLSPALLAEYQAVLMRPKLAALHRLQEGEVDRLLTEVTLNALWREPFERPGRAPDPGDDHLWALLDHEPNAVLITGDQRLLNDPHDHAIVMLPAVFLETARRGSAPP